MCKVFGVAGITNKNRGDIIKISKEVAKHMTKFEKDGFGYAAIDSEGNVFGEKWLKPEHIFNKRITRKVKPLKEIIPSSDQKIFDKFGDLIQKYGTTYSTPAPPVYDKFGDGELGNISALIMHSRMSTGGGKTIENVHPFVNYETALVHNGIVYNEDEPIFYKLTSDCDSEILLNRYNDALVAFNPKAIEEAVDPVEAYFACLVLTKGLDKDENEIPIMDIFKADAELEIVYINDLDLYTFCTRGQIVIDVCKEFGYSTSKAIKVNDNYLIRLNAVNGDILLKEHFSYTGRFGYSTGANLQNSYKSRYGENWQDHYDRDLVDDTPEYRKDDSEDDEEPDYREGKSAKESAKVFIDATKGPKLLTDDELNECKTMDKIINKYKS